MALKFTKRYLSDIVASIGNRHFRKLSTNNGTAGLSYTLSADGTYTCTGIGTATDNDIAIASEFKGVRVTSIDSEAFLGCTGLTSVTIPDSVTSICSYVFYYCDNLTSVTIGDSVESIGDSVFSGCKSLTSIDVNIDNQFYKSIYGNLYSKDGKTLIQYTIGKKDNSFAIPDSVESISNSAFLGCTSLTSVTIPDRVTSIGNAAFYRCDSLTSVTIGDSVENIGNYAFAWCERLASVTIPNSVTSIGEWAFNYCTSLMSVTIGNGVTSIGEEAFSGCTRLTSVNITDIAAWCNISFAYYNSNPLDYAKNLYLNGELVTELIIPDSITSIGDYAFYNCDSITSVTIPYGVTIIGKSAFSGCDSLTDVVYGGTEEQWKKIGIGANNNSLTNANIQYTGTEPEEPSNNGTKGLKYTLSADGTYYTCTGIGTATDTDIVIASEFDGVPVTSIGDYAFNEREKLTSVTIPDSITSIGDYAFVWCERLASVTIPDSVESIGYKAFLGCTSLANVYYGGTEKQWDSIEIGDENESLTNANIHYIDNDDSGNGDDNENGGESGGESGGNEPEEPTTKEIPVTINAFDDSWYYPTSIIYNDTTYLLHEGGSFTASPGDEIIIYVGYYTVDSMIWFIDDEYSDIGFETYYYWKIPNNATSVTIGEINYIAGITYTTE